MEWNKISALKFQKQREWSENANKCLKLEIFSSNFGFNFPVWLNVSQTVCNKKINQKIIKLRMFDLKTERSL